MEEEDNFLLVHLVPESLLADDRALKMDHEKMANLLKRERDLQLILASRLETDRKLQEISKILSVAHAAPVPPAAGADEPSAAGADGPSAAAADAAAAAASQDTVSATEEGVSSSAADKRWIHAPSCSFSSRRA